MLSRSTFLTLIFSVAVSLPQYSQALPFTSVTVFGDSLSDVGNVETILNSQGRTLAPLFVDGRFSNGPNYVDQIATGSSSTPSLRAGTNYAVGGARTDFHPDLGNAFSIQSQVANYINAAPATITDPSALHILWGGANDIQEALTALAGGGNAAGEAVVRTAANNVNAMIDDLLIAGINSLVLPNIPDIGLTPRVVELANTLGNPALIPVATGYSMLINQLVDAHLAALMTSADIFRIDVFGLLSDASSLGFANATDPCFLLGPGADCSSHVFWDDFHPTTAAHGAIARAIITAVPEPASFFLVLAGAAGLCRRNICGSASRESKW